MRLLTWALCVSLGLSLGISPAAADDPPAGEPKAPPLTLELVEDLRILSILNGLQPTRAQCTKLAAVAGVGRDGLSAIDAEVKSKLEPPRPLLLAARERLLRGGAAPETTDIQLARAAQAAESTRAQRTEALIQNLIARLRGILTPEQAARIESELAPTFDQPWRRYGRVISGPGAGAAGGRMPADPGRWLNELRDLRLDSAEGDPQHEVEDFAKKLTRGLRPGTPLFDQSYSQAKAFATQALTMPPNVFAQREGELARMAARQELDTRNQQRAAEGKPAETFDPFRWLVEQVLLSPRAAVDLRDRAAAR